MYVYTFIYMYIHISAVGLITLGASHSSAPFLLCAVDATHISRYIGCCFSRPLITAHLV